MPTLLKFFQNQKSSKINHSSRDMSLSEGCEIALYINKYQNYYFMMGKS